MKKILFLIFFISGCSILSSTTKIDNYKLLSEEPNIKTDKDRAIYHNIKNDYEDDNLWYYSHKKRGALLSKKNISKQ